MVTNEAFYENIGYTLVTTIHSCKIAFSPFRLAQGKNEEESYMAKSPSPKYAILLTSGSNSARRITLRSGYKVRNQASGLVDQ
jgi:hypothetical protein